MLRVFALYTAAQKKNQLKQFSLGEKGKKISSTMEIRAL